MFLCSFNLFLFSHFLCFNKLLQSTISNVNVFFYLTVFSNIYIHFLAFFQLMKTILIVLVYNNNTGSELINFLFSSDLFV